MPLLALFYFIIEKRSKNVYRRINNKKVKCIEKEYERARHGYHCYVSFQYENLIFYVDNPLAYENIKIDDCVEIVFRKKCTHLDKKNPKNNHYKLIASILKIKNQEIRCYEGNILEL